MYTIDGAPSAMLRNYVDYVEGKIDINEIPLDFEQWQENEPQETPDTDTTQPGTIYEQKKKRFFELFEIFFEAFDNDINSGLEDGTYEQADNVENLALIDEAEKLLPEMKEYTPEIYILIEGGRYQGASATESMAVDVYDTEEYEARKKAVEENDTETMRRCPLEDYKSPDERDEWIKKKTAEKFITGVY